MTTKKEMIERQLKGRNITDERVLQAMEKVDRALFVPEDLQEEAYEDGPLPIGRSQTISQPYIVAYMAQELQLQPEDVVLEVGTGCGYNAAVMAELCQQVYSVEIIKWLAELAQKNLKKAGVHNVNAHFGDGYEGWPEKAPFDAISLTAAPAVIPEPLKDQLKPGGKILAPVGTGPQKLTMLEKVAENDFRKKNLLMVNFVPMTGRAQK